FGGRGGEQEAAVAAVGLRERRRGFADRAGRRAAHLRAERLAARRHLHRRPAIPDGRAHHPRLFHITHAYLLSHLYMIPRTPLIFLSVTMPPSTACTVSV